MMVRGTEGEGPSRICCLHVQGRRVSQEWKNPYHFSQATLILVLRTFITCTLHLVKGREIGRACSTNGGEEEYIQDIDGKARRKETTGKTKT
jgi:hypothetical protein